MVRWMHALVAISIAAGCDKSDEPDDGGSTAGSETSSATASTTVASGSGSTSGSGTGGSTCDADPPPPGCPGGKCLAPTAGGSEPTCLAATCNLNANYCFDPADPCLGFTCGGAERGTCSATGGMPECTCNAGFENETYALYCCPLDGSDPSCA